MNAKRSASRLNLSKQLINLPLANLNESQEFNEENNPPILLNNHSKKKFDKLLQDGVAQSVALKITQNSSHQSEVVLKLEKMIEGLNKFRHDFQAQRELKFQFKKDGHAHDVNLLQGQIKVQLRDKRRGGMTKKRSNFICNLGLNNIGHQRYFNSVDFNQEGLTPGVRKSSQTRGLNISRQSRSKIGNLRIDSTVIQNQREFMDSNEYSLQFSARKSALLPNYNKSESRLSVNAIHQTNQENHSSQHLSPNKSKTEFICPNTNLSSKKFNFEKVEEDIHEEIIAYDQLDNQQTNTTFQDDNYQIQPQKEIPLKKISLQDDYFEQLQRNKKKLQVKPRFTKYTPNIDTLKQPNLPILSITKQVQDLNIQDQSPIKVRKDTNDNLEIRHVLQDLNSKNQSQTLSRKNSANKMFRNNKVIKSIDTKAEQVIQSMRESQRKAQVSVTMRETKKKYQSFIDTKKYLNQSPILELKINSNNQTAYNTKQTFYTSTQQTQQNPNESNKTITLITSKTNTNAQNTPRLQLQQLTKVKSKKDIRSSGSPIREFQHLNYLRNKRTSMFNTKQEIIKKYAVNESDLPFAKFAKKQEKLKLMKEQYRSQQQSTNLNSNVKVEDGLSNDHVQDDQTILVNLTQPLHKIQEKPIMTIRLRNTKEIANTYGVLDKVKFNIGNPNSNSNNHHGISNLGGTTFSSGSAGSDRQSNKQRASYEKIGFKYI